MPDIHPQYMKDNAGKKSLVVLTVEKFELMVEELDDVRLFDKAKKEDDGNRISFSDYLKSRKLLR